MPKYLVVTPKKIVQFDSHSDAFNEYETLPKPCGVYEVSGVKQGIITKKQLEITGVYAVNVKAEFHGDYNSSECFIHLHTMLNNNNYKEATR